MGEKRNQESSNLWCAEACLCTSSWTWISSLVVGWRIRLNSQERHAPLWGAANCCQQKPTRRHDRHKEMKGLVRGGNRTQVKPKPGQWQGHGDDSNSMSDSSALRGREKRATAWIQTLTQKVQGTELQCFKIIYIFLQSLGIIRVNSDQSVIWVEF